jgi:hypothetical protein
MVSRETEPGFALRMARHFGRAVDHDFVHRVHRDLMNRPLDAGGARGGEVGNVEQRLGDQLQSLLVC